MLFLRLSMTAFIALDEDEKQRVVIRAGSEAATDAVLVFLLHILGFG